MHLISLVFVPLVAAIPTINVRQVGKAVGTSCTNMELVNGYPGTGPTDNLKGSCSGQDGKNMESSLDLNQCVGIDHTTNTLIWKPLGKLRNYCNTCSLQEGNVLACTCNKQATTLKLDDGVVNQDGTLSCR